GGGGGGAVAGGGGEPLTVERGEPLTDELVVLSPPVHGAVETAAGLVKTIVRNLTATELHGTEENGDVSSGLGMGDRRDRRGDRDRLDDCHANPTNAAVLPEERDAAPSWGDSHAPATKPRRQRGPRSQPPN